MQSNTLLRDIISTEKLMGNNNNNNNNLNNNGSPGADIMFQMEDDGLTQLGSVFQSAYQSIVGGGPQVREKKKTSPQHRFQSPADGNSLYYLETLRFTDRVALELALRGNFSTPESWNALSPRLFGAAGLAPLRPGAARMRHLETSSFQSPRFFTVHSVSL